MSSSGTFWKFGAGLLMVYYIYFLWKRRSDSLSKQRMNKFRLQKKEKHLYHKNPDIEKMVIGELRLGREFLNKGDTASAVQHYSNALALTSYPEKLMDYFQYGLPPEICQLLPYQKPVEDKKWSNPEFMAEFIRKTEKTESSIKAIRVKEQPVTDVTESHHKFLMRELESGEEFLAEGNITNGIERISNVLAACLKPQKLMQALQKRLSPEIYQLLISQITSTERTFDSKPESAGMVISKEIQAPKID